MFMLLLAALAFTKPPSPAVAAEPGEDVFRRDNLVAWCIVPFDAKKRTPAERVEMLKKLGFTKFAYDWRAEHLPTFDEEVGLLKKARIELTAVWFPAALNDDAGKLLAVIEKHKVTPQLWVMFPEPPVREQLAKVNAAARALRPVAESAAKLDCKLALYNHGGWSGEPENQIAVIEALGLKNVGIVYNLHHGHDHLDRFPGLLKAMKPHLLALNLNGMVKGGDRTGKKILPLGAGAMDLELLKVIRASGYAGPIGILGHTQDDAAERLADNLDGLAWLTAHLRGEQPDGTVKYRTYKR
jgi:sugar phosphate isomerase/epimerase